MDAVIVDQQLVVNVELRPIDGSEREPVVRGFRDAERSFELKRKRLLRFYQAWETFDEWSRFDME